MGSEKNLYIALNDRTINNSDLRRMWKEVVMTYFKVLFQHLPGGSWEMKVKPQSK
jgi:hypothetical protein